MSFFRKLSRKIFGTYLVTLAGFLYYKIKEFDEKQENVVRGKPITVDRTELAKAGREKDIRSGVVYKYVEGEGMVMEEYHDDGSSAGPNKEASDTTSAPKI